MKWAWTWCGQCFGYWDGDDLWTYGGKHVGRRKDNDIFGPHGWYVGEIMANGRLITNKAKVGQKGSMFTPLLARKAAQVQANGLSLALYPGHQDFPHPDMF